LCALSSYRAVSFLFYRSGAHRDLHSFPTRRSSDLIHMWAARGASLNEADWLVFDLDPAKGKGIEQAIDAAIIVRRLLDNLHLPRSEEHTSELQSRRDLVCRLLLEKKNARHDRGSVF